MNKELNLLNQLEDYNNLDGSDKMMLKIDLEDRLIPAGQIDMESQKVLNAIKKVILGDFNGTQDGDAVFGFQALAVALQSPLRILVQNAGQDIGAIVLQLEHTQEDESFSPWVGWDVLESRSRLLDESPMVVDATLVALEALRYTVSSVATIITTEAMVVRR